MTHLELYEFINKTGQDSGIYRITNKLNNKVYIGSSKNVKIRIKRHLYDSIKKTKFIGALKKYGVGNFDFELLEYIEVKKGENYLKEREQVYLDLYFANEFILGENYLFREITYNTNPYALRPYPSKRNKKIYTEEEKNQMYARLKSYLENIKEKGISLKGRKKSEHEIEKNRNSLIKSIGKKIYKIDKELNKTHFDSISLAAEEIGVSHCTIRDCCKGRSKTCKGFYFCYEEDLEKMIFLIQNPEKHKVNRYGNNSQR